MWYKVHHDGSHYVAKRVEKDITHNKRPRLRSELSDFEKDFRDCYKHATVLGLRRKKEIKSFVKDQLSADYCYLSNFEENIERELDRELLNLYNRKKRFRRKAYLNDWNYFCTFTYDAKMMSEEEFKTRLRRCLSNLHSRRGWRYMGVWERGERGNRLHFHALVFVPEGEMVGVLFDEEYYDKKSHSRKVAHRNTFFDLRFGRSDFKKLSSQEVKHGTVMNYLLKYLQKTGEKIIYSRGIPSEEILPLQEDDLICSFVNYVEFFVVDPDCIWFSSDVELVDAYEMDTPYIYRC